jgi:hypothetical protein
MAVARLHRGSDATLPRRFLSRSVNTRRDAPEHSVHIADLARCPGRLNSVTVEECHSFGCCLVFRGRHHTEGTIMRVFVTGATGALGRHLVPGLVAAGHEVTAATRTPGKVAQLREAGAEPVVVDGLDREAVIAAVRAAAPEVIVHEMTALAGPAELPQSRQTVRGHERAADQGHRQPAGGRGAGGRPPGHRARLRGPRAGQALRRWAED